MRSIDTTLPGNEFWATEAESARERIAEAEGEAVVARKRAQQEARRRAQAERMTGTPLTAKEADFLFRTGTIVELPQA